MLRITPLLIVILFLSGCVTRTHQLTTTLNRSGAEQPSIVLMPLDVELSTMSAGGQLELRADWTQAANTLLLEAIRAEKQKRNFRMVVFDEAAVESAKNEANHQLIKLHGVVGNAILLHQYAPGQQLPNKYGVFEWSLGPAAKQLKETYSADYALFVWVRDSYTSGGRAVAMFLAAAAFGVALQGGQQVGFASLVELETGKIVWFNMLARGAGDLRHAEGAADTAQYLMAKLPE